ncbi:MAG: hypothetical protein ACO1N0_03810 [Fluviicola sp.]
MKRLAALIVLMILGLTTTYAQVFEWVTSIEQNLNTWYYGLQPIALDNDHLLTTFSFKGTIDADPGIGVQEFQASGSGNMDICIRKLNSDGTLQWARHFETPIQDYVVDIAAGSSQSTYVLVSFGSDVDLDPGVTGGEETAGLVLIKLDAAGNYEWSKKMGFPSAQSLVIDSNDNLLISGRFMDNVDFDPGPGIFLVDGGNVANTYILKLNVSGDFQWVSITDSEHCFIADLAVDLSGNIYHTGFFYETVDFDPGVGIDMHTSFNQYPDFYVQKLNGLGEHQWTNTYGGSMHDDAKVITVNTLGDVYIGGIFKETVDFNPGAGDAILQVADEADMFLQKLNTQGEFQWVKQYSIQDLMFPEDLACDSSEDVYVAGRLRDPDDDPYLSPTTNIFVYKLNEDGSPVWESMIDGLNDNFAASIELGAANELYISGIWGDSTDFDPTGDTHFLFDYGTPMFITKWNTTTLGLS